MFLLKFKTNSNFKINQKSEDGFELLKEDITWELNGILNTFASQFGRKDLLTLNYGIPDFFHLSVKSSSDIAQLKKKIMSAIGEFEKRLHHVAVNISQANDSKNSLNVQVNAKVFVDDEYRDLAFLFGI